MSQPGHEHAGDDEFLVGDDEFKAATGESIERTLDLSTWHAGVDLGALYQRLEAEVGPALEQERRVQNVVRSDVFPLLRTAHDAPAEAGVHQAAPADLEEVHRKVLFSGELDTCDGTSITHDTLLLTVTQIGVCLISYQGDELALSQRMFRRDLRTVGSDPVEEAKDLLARRKDRTAVGFTDKRDTLRIGPPRHHDLRGTRHPAPSVYSRVANGTRQHRSVRAAHWLGKHGAARRIAEGAAGTGRLPAVRVRAILDQRQAAPHDRRRPRHA